MQEQRRGLKVLAAIGPSFFRQSPSCFKESRQTSRGVRGERIDELDAAQAPAVLHIFAEERSAADLPCRGPNHGIPEREPMLIHRVHGIDKGRVVGEMT